MRLHYSRAAPKVPKLIKLQLPLAPIEVPLIYQVVMFEESKLLHCHILSSWLRGVNFMLFILQLMPINRHLIYHITLSEVHE